MLQINKSKNIKLCISQLKPHTTPDFCVQLEQLMYGVPDNVFDVVMLGIEDFCKKINNLTSPAAIKVIIQELLIYCENCKRLSQQTTNSIHNFEILPPVLKQRLLSTLQKELKISTVNAAEFIGRVEHQIITPGKLMLEKYNNLISFNSDYKQLYYTSISLEKRWLDAVKQNSQMEIKKIKSFFQQMFDESGLTQDFTDEITSKKLNKILMRLLKKSIAQLHALATFNQLQSTQDRWIDADSLRSFKSDEVRNEKHHQKISDFYTGNPSINIFSREYKNRCRMAEEVAFANGIGEIAKEEGAMYAGLMTCTLPTEFHYLSAGRPNPKYQHKTVKDGHDLLQKSWRNTRACLHHKNKIAHFIKAVHPHRSGVPHMHAVVFLNSRNHIRLLVTQMASRLNQHDNWIIYWSDDVIETSTGISSHPDQSKSGIVFNVFDNHSNAVGAAVKYCLKGLKRICSGAVDNEESLRIQAWCSTHSIRRYSSSAVGKTLWRDLRKLPDFGSEAQNAAKAGDYAKFYQITQRDKNEILLPMQKKTGDSRIWIFAKKITTDSPLVFVNYIQPRTPKVPREIVENKTHAVVDLPCHTLTVIYNKRDRMTSLNKIHIKDLLSGVFRVGKSFLKFFKSSFQLLRKLVSLRL